MRLKLRITHLAVVALASALFSRSTTAQVPPTDRQVVLATTTSFRDTGLLDSLLPEFERQSGWHIRAIAVGSGQALRMGERGDADVLIVHAPSAEDVFMAAGFGTRRRVVAWNHFALAGPADDPAHAGSAPSAPDALRRIAAGAHAFVSRGDSSGTHLRELALWTRAGGRPSWRGYVETGQGMAMTLLVADERHAYVLTDRATLAAFRHRVNLVPLRPPESSLINVYHVIELRRTADRRINVEGARAFADWLVSPAGQNLIAAFGPPGAALFEAARGREPEP